MQVLDDEYETPLELYEQLCKKYKLNPNLDVCATNQNKKCDLYFSKNTDALKETWLLGYGESTTIWCNPPHSMTEQFVRKAYEQWVKFNINIMMIIPANSLCTKYANECIINNAKFYPITGRPRFLKNGKPSDNTSRNSYFVVIWRAGNG